MKGREDLESNSSDRVIRIIRGYVSGYRRSAYFRSFWIGYIGLYQCLSERLTIRQPVYLSRQGTYGIANFSMQVTDVVNVLAIGEISVQPIK